MIPTSYSSGILEVPFHSLIVKKIIIPSLFGNCHLKIRKTCVVVLFNFTFGIKLLNEKKETKESGWDLHLWKRDVKEENFLHTQKSSHGQAQGEVMETQREQSNRCMDAKPQENSEQRSVMTST